MNDDNPTGEVRPMIDRAPPNADKTQGAVVGKTALPGLVRALGALPLPAKRHMAHLWKAHPGNVGLD